VTLTQPPPRSSRPQPRRRDVTVLFCLAGASGAALVAQLLFDLDMTWTAGLLVLPASALLVVVVFAGQRRYDRLGVISDRLVAGATWGLAATLVYDLIRPLTVWLFQYDFPPYKAHAIFGQLITGRPSTDTVAIVVGWVFHFWNGVSFGVMLSLIRPRPGWLIGWAWAMVLQLAMMALYPRYLQVRLDTPGFLMTTFVGHSAYGLVLGETLRRRGVR
jgi:hypothetical protein